MICWCGFVFACGLGCVVVCGCISMYRFVCLVGYLFCNFRVFVLRCCTVLIVVFCFGMDLYVCGF